MNNDSSAPIDYGDDPPPLRTTYPVMRKGWASIPLWPDDSAEKRDSSVDQMGVWTALMFMCSINENGGRIPDCRRWSAARWKKERVTRHVLHKPCPLWRWEGDDLVVNGYGGKFFNPAYNEPAGSGPA